MRIGRHRATGFTLIEIMTAVAIVGVLSAMAAQNYGLAASKAKRKGGFAALNGLLPLQRAHFSEYNDWAYEPWSIAVDFDGAIPVSGGAWSGSWQGRHYELGFHGDPTQHYWLAWANGNDGLAGMANDIGIDDDAFPDVMWVGKALPAAQLHVSDGVVLVADDFTNTIYGPGNYGTP